MKQDFIRDLKTAEFSYSASRVNELYEIWEWIKYYFLFDILKNKDDIENDLKYCFFESIEQYPNGSQYTYFDSVYGILCSEALWYQHESQLISTSYLSAYQLMHDNLHLVVLDELNSPIVEESFLCHAQKLYLKFMTKEMIDLYPEYLEDEYGIYSVLSFLIRYYPNLPHEMYYDNIAYEKENEKLLSNEKLSYLFGMCFHDFLVERYFISTVNKKILKKEQKIYFDWLKYNSYNDILLYPFVMEGIEAQAKRSINKTRKVKKYIKE